MAATTAPMMATATKPGTEINSVNAERSGSSPTEASYTLSGRSAGAAGRTREFVGKVMPSGITDGFGVLQNQGPGILNVSYVIGTPLSQSILRKSHIVWTVLRADRFYAGSPESAYSGE